MILYNYLFYFIYKLIKSIELDIPSAKHDDRVFETVCFLSIFQTLNVALFLDSEGMKMLWVPGITILAFNILFFSGKEKFKNIMKHFDTSPPSKLLKVMVTVYLIVSVMAPLLTSMI